MCKRCITPSYDSSFAQKETHIFVYSLYKIAVEKFQSNVYQLRVIFCQLSIL